MPKRLLEESSQHIRSPRSFFSPRSSSRRMALSFPLMVVAYWFFFPSQEKAEDGDR